MIMKCKVTVDTSHYPKDVPFEVPEGWCWCKITDVVDKLTDGTHTSPKSYPAGAYMYVTAKNIKSGGLDLSNITYVNSEVHREIYSRCNPEKGDILYIKDGATCGISTINNLDVEFSLLSSVALIKPNKNVLNTYLNLFLQSAFCYRNVRESMKGVGITRIILKQMELWDIPLPPYAEQNRIVTAAEQLLQIAGGIEREQIELGENIVKAKARILDLAIHGKLVPQDPSDEPAIQLLKRINPDFVPSDNLHYEGVIPDGWQICRLSDLFKVTMGQSPDGTSLNRSTGIEFHQGKICFTEKYLSESDIFTTSATKCAEPNSLLCCVRAPVGVFNITSRRICIGRGLCSLSPLDADVDIEYWFYALSSLTEYYESMATGSTFKAISGDIIRNTVIAVPPKMEQQRILKQITSLFSILKEASDAI